MSIFKIPYFPKIYDPDAKVIAWDILKKHGMDSGPLPVDVEKLAGRLNYAIGPIPRLRSLFDIKGTSHKDLETGGIVIVLDQDHYFEEEFSCPFTIAEEIAHLEVHGLLLKSITSVQVRVDLENSMNDSTHQAFEVQAKKVASQLLLPSDVFDPYVEDWCKKNWTGIIAENLMDESDFERFLTSHLSRRIGLSTFIIERAIGRQVPDKLSTRLIKNLGVKLANA